MILKKVKICGRRINTVYDDKLESRHGNRGLYDHQQSIISIEPDMSQDMQEETWIHEFLHAVDDVVGFIRTDDEKEEERILCSFAGVLYQVLKDNDFGVFFERGK